MSTLGEFGKDFVPQTNHYFSNPCFQQNIATNNTKQKVGESWQDSQAYYLMTMDGIAQYDKEDYEEFEADRKALEEQINSSM
jgi:hypothetical protein